MKKNIHIYLMLTLFFLIMPLAIVAKSDQKSDRQSNLSLEDKRKFDYFFYSAINAKTINQYSSAFDYLNYCNKIDSTNANVLYELGNFYKTQKNLEKANDYYTKAVYYDPQNYIYNMSLAGTLLEKQDYAKSINIYENVIKNNPNRIELYMYLSEAYRMSGDFKKSINALDNLERTMGMNENITMQKFKLYAALDEKKNAYAEVQKYIDKNPEDVRYYALLANFYMQDNKMKEAYDILMKGKAIDPDDSFLISTLASYYDLTNNTEFAEDILQSALFSNKIDADTKIDILGQYIATMQQKEQDLSKANNLMDSLMTEYPQESKYNLLYGNLLMLQKKKEEANFQFRIFAESNPTNPIGWEQLLQTTDFDNADALIEVCQSAINYLPQESLFYLYLSVGQFQKKEYDLALETAQKGIDNTDPQNTILLSEFYSQKGNLYYEIGKTDSTFINYDLALSYNPQNLGVLNNYGYYLSLLKKDLDRAEQMSSITVKAEPTNPTYLDTYGWILFEQGAFQMAKIYLENAVKYSEEKGDISSEVLEHFGDVLYKTDEPDKALEYWIKAKAKGDGGSSNLDKKIETKTYIAE